MRIAERLLFASRYVVRHLLISVVVAAAAAAVVFGAWYPAPYRDMLGVAGIFVLILAVDVACGPVLTLVLSSPKKSPRERLLDFSMVGAVQVAALLYGLHSVWVARPVVVAFEADRLVVVTANEIDPGQLPQAPQGMRQLPNFGVMRVATTRPASSEEFFESVDLSAAGISPAMRPGRWRPWEDARDAMAQRARPVAELLAARPQDAAVLQDAIRASGLPVAELRYLPLTSSRTKDWVALLDGGLNLVGWAPVDGF